MDRDRSDVFFDRILFTACFSYPVNLGMALTKNVLLVLYAY